jgi:hypothetical protein
MTLNKLYHHGILGMKWGVRRYQNKDGSLTLAGKQHYGVEYEQLYDKANDKAISVGTKSYQRTISEAEKSIKSGKSITNSELETKLQDNLNKDLYEFYSTDPDVKAARQMCKKYNMTSWNEMAEDLEDSIKSVEEAMKKSQRG